MKTMLHAAFAIVLVFFTLAYAQSGFAGKWSSDPAEVAAAESAASAAFRAQAAVPPTGGGPAAFSATSSMASIGGVQMDLALDGKKVTGSILQGGMTVKITDGSFDGKIATLKSQRPTGATVLEQTWTAEMKDNDTFVLKVEVHLAGAQPNPGGSNIVPVTLHRVK